MSFRFYKGDAARHFTGKIVKVVLVEDDLVYVETPSGAVQLVKERSLTPLDLNAEEIEFGFHKAFLGWTWGGWN
jgi:hypothetical protein